MFFTDRHQQNNECRNTEDKFFTNAAKIAHSLVRKNQKEEAKNVFVSEKKQVKEKPNEDNDQK